VDQVPLDDPAAYSAAVRRLLPHLAGADLAVAPTVTSFPITHAAALAGVPAVQRVGESAPLPTVCAWQDRALHPAVEEQARRAFGAAQVVWSNSHAVERVYREHGYDGSWRVVHTGRPQTGRGPSREEARRRLGVAAHRRLLVFAGTIWPVKGQGLLVEAVRILGAEHPDLLVALVGDDTQPYAAHLRDHLRHTGIDDQVLVAPFEDDLSLWWAAADGVALTPTEESEALSSALVEGMAHGLPALATRSGDAAEMVEEGRSGWLADADDLGSLVDALRRAAGADLRVWRAYGEHAAARCAREDDRETALGTVTALLRRAATTQPSPAGSA